MPSSVPDLEAIGHKAPMPLLSQLRREVGQLLGRDSHHFPGAQPVSFARKHLRELKTRDYFLCEKSDGIRCLLYFTKDDESHGFSELHYLIDRKNNYYFVPNLHFCKPGMKRDDPPDWASYHVDTLLDGELLWDTYPDNEIDGDGKPVLSLDGKPKKKRVLKYLVFDCLVMDGQNLCAQTLEKRLGYYIKQIQEPYESLRKAFPQDCEGFPFHMEKKSTQRSYGTEMMQRDIIPNLKHGSDGLIFTCRETAYQTGTDEHILKWKPAEENTIDFKLDLRFPPLNHLMNGNANADYDEDDLDYDAIPTFNLLMFMGNDRDNYFDTMYATAEDWESMKAWSIEHNLGLDGQIIECFKDDKGRWRFHRFRDDKTDANHVSTVESVMESIDDAVGWKDLHDAGYDIKKAWYAREAELRRFAEEQQKRRLAEKQQQQMKGK